MSRFVMVCLTLSLNGSAGVAWHPGHASLSEAEYNSKTGKLEIAMQVHAPDLEELLRKRSQGKIKLDQSKATDAALQDYLKRVFVVVDRSGKSRPLEWVGKEIEVQDVWLYFEVPIPDGPQGIRIKNTLLLDFAEDQVNTMNFKNGKQRTSLIFNQREVSHTLKFAKP